MTPAARGILRGVALLARFRAEGLAGFGDSAQLVLNSLAPLLAFPVAYLVIVLLSGRLNDAADLLGLIDVMLLQAVLSELAARRWGREAEWGRYMIAFNWCQWALPVVGIALVIGSGVMIGGGLAPDQGATLVILLLAAYALALQWFLAWKALRLTAGRAGLLVLGINLCATVMILAPTELRLMTQPAS